MRRRTTPAGQAPGVAPGPLPLHLSGSGQAYARHVGLDWATQWPEVRREQRAARLAWFAERGLVDAAGHIDYRRADELGLMPSQRKGTP